MAGYPRCDSSPRRTERSACVCRPADTWVFRRGVASLPWLAAEGDLGKHRNPARWGNPYGYCPQLVARALQQRAEGQAAEGLSEDRPASLSAVPGCEPSNPRFLCVLAALWVGPGELGRLREPGRVELGRASAAGRTVASRGRERGPDFQSLLPCAFHISPASPAQPALCQWPVRLQPGPGGDRGHLGREELTHAPLLTLPSLPEISHRETPGHAWGDRQRAPPAGPRDALGAAGRPRGGTSLAPQP